MVIRRLDPGGWAARFGIPVHILRLVSFPDQALYMEAKLDLVFSQSVVTALVNGGCGQVLSAVD